MTHPQLRDILLKLRQHFGEVYRDRLVNVILFGSQARGDAQPESDIDILIALDPPIHPVDEIKRNSESITNLCLEYSTFAACVYMETSQFQQANSPLLLNIRRDGVAV